MPQLLVEAAASGSYNPSPLSPGQLPSRQFNFVNQAVAGFQFRLQYFVVQLLLLSCLKSCFIANHLQLNIITNGGRGLCASRCGRYGKCKSEVKNKSIFFCIYFSVIKAVDGLKITANGFRKPFHISIIYGIYTYIQYRDLLVKSK